MHGYISAVDAEKTKFSEDDLKLLWESLINAFEIDHAAARGEMNPGSLLSLSMIAI
jgi:CRISPR-associated protein Csd2